jgi:hypothetical protein
MGDVMNGPYDYTERFLEVIAYSTSIVIFYNSDDLIHNQTDKYR